jgi:hypothetical protein
METDDFKARFVLGSLVSLQQRGGHEIVRPPAQLRGVGIHCVTGSYWAGMTEGPETGVADRAVFRLGKFAGLEGATAENVLQVDRANRELTLRQQARAPSKGVWGVSWTVAQIPLEYAILVPGNSGLRLTADSPGPRHQFDYPISWEAQLVIVEGTGRGFYVWADDTKGRYKRLVVERGPNGWRLEFITINDAPFDGLTSCESVVWRIGTYEGDWRVPARKYRQWMESHFHPTPVERQRPAWVKDIRGCVIMGQETKVLEALPRRFDPHETLLYLPGWRFSGYDRNYPEYDKPVAELAPFVRRAHELGFHVMLHVNYFGVDPLNPLYKEFEPYQVRDPFGAHEKQWWLWTDADPIIKFAYINPAARKWRDHFVACMVKLCRRTGADALHLDQTLCIYNDHNGRIDGLSMLEGNVALHRELREALPEVALSGEGLDEVTCRYEAFAQRHVPGLDHTHGTWSRPWLETAHPISSYLLRPYTIMYGYLGCAPPGSDQLYAAWNEAYRHWGVIPTLAWPSKDSLLKPAGFARQFFDELAFWQTRGLTIDWEAPWPAEVIFPYRTADGRPAVRTRDGRLVCDGREISRIVSGVGEVEGTGTIPAWGAFDERRLVGLNPERWYPYFTEPRDPRDFHVCELPKDLVVEAVAEAGDLAMVRTRSANLVVADLGRLIERAVCGSRPSAKRETWGLDPMLDSLDGAMFQGDSEVLSAHPPWKIAGSGIAFADYKIDLPAAGRLELKADVALDPGAVGPGKSDGVTFAATARLGDRQLRAQLHNSTAERRPLSLDLTPFAGKRVTVELSVDPGPKRNPSYDWARWFRPRIERHGESQGTLAVSGGKEWKLAVGPAGGVEVEAAGGRRRVKVPLPGAVFFLEKQPDAADLPLDLARRPCRVILLSDSGIVLPSAQYAGVSRQPSTVGGVVRDGLFAHPPDHGRTVALLPMTLPSEPATLKTWVGIRDGSRSDGVQFVVELNGREAARKRMLPGKWESLTADLGPWAGKPVVLALATDSDGPFICDWAAWGEPRIEAK